MKLEKRIERGMSFKRAFRNKIFIGSNKKVERGVPLGTEYL
jgi:hypothetical protein